MRVHLLAFPTTQTTKDYTLCGFTATVVRFAHVLKLLNYHVTLYASEENEAPCDELVTVITKEEQQTLLGEMPYQVAPMEGARTWPLWALANPRMIRAIAERKQPRDLICTIGGTAQQPVLEAHPDLLGLEFSIGYMSSFAKYRVYELHCWRSCTHGWEVQRDHKESGGGYGRFFDAVIPLFFNRDAFRLQTRKEPFALFVGRLTESKGIGIACQAAALAGVPLKVIGHGMPSLVTHGAEFLGTLPDVERNDWMARASCLVCPTQYLEPFGAIAVEAQLCGTPVVCTDFGGFVETVQDGLTGFRCHYLGEFAEALHQVRELDPVYIRDRAVAMYSFEAVAPQYQRYFERLQLLWDQGWHTPMARAAARDAVLA